MMDVNDRMSERLSLKNIMEKDRYKHHKSILNLIKLYEHKLDDDDYQYMYLKNDEIDYGIEIGGVRFLHLEHVLVKNKYEYKNKKKKKENDEYLKKYFDDIPPGFPNLKTWLIANDVIPNCIGTRVRLGNYLGILRDKGYIRQEIKKDKRLTSVKVWRLEKKFWDKLLKYNVIKVIKNFEDDNKLSYKPKFTQSLDQFISCLLYGFSDYDLQRLTKENAKEFFNCMDNLIRNFSKITKIFNGRKNICLIMDNKFQREFNKKE